MSAGHWWTSGEHLAAMNHILDQRTGRDTRGPSQAADALLASLTPTIQRLQRDAQTKFLRGLVDRWKQEVHRAEHVGGPAYREGWEDAIRALEAGLDQ